MATSTDPTTAASYLAELGGVLLSYGCPTERLEGLIRELARIEGLEGQAFAIPTGLFVSVCLPGQPPVIQMVRVEDWATDLHRLTLVDELFNAVAERKMPMAKARELLKSLPDLPSPYPRWLRTIAPGIATASAAVFFEADWLETLLALVGGVILGELSFLRQANTSLRYLENFIGGAFAALWAILATAIEPSASREVLVLSLVMLLVPGMTLTTGLAEITHKNLVAGTARLMYALVVLLSLVFGIAMVFSIEQRWGISLPTRAQPADHAVVPQIFALILAAIGFSVRFQVPTKFWLGALGSCSIAWASVKLVPPGISGAGATFFASLLLGLYSNALARRLNRPAQLFLLPGFVLLVPGSFGFQSFEALLRGDVVSGATSATTTALVAGAIVTGAVLANVLIVPKKHL